MANIALRPVQIDDAARARANGELHADERAAGGEAHRGNGESGACRPEGAIGTDAVHVEPGGERTGDLAERQEHFYREQLKLADSMSVDPKAKSFTQQISLAGASAEEGAAVLRNMVDDVVARVAVNAP